MNQWLHSIKPSNHWNKPVRILEQVTLGLMDDVRVTKRYKVYYKVIETAVIE